MIDTHCHIFLEYYSDIDMLMSKIKDSGVTKIIVNGCDMKSNKEVLRLIDKYDIVYGALGFQPTELSGNDTENIKWLEEHINDKKIVAVGEIGLDYHYDDTDKKRQIDMFKKQLELASKYHKPVIVHTRDAIKDTYDILSVYKLNGSIHAYSGSLEMAKEFTKLGYFLGIGGVATFKNAKNIVDVIKEIPLEYLLLETDSPYLTPEPFRGQVNTPCNIPLIAKRIAEIKEIDMNEVVAVTTKSADSLFDF